MPFPSHPDDDRPGPSDLADFSIDDFVPWSDADRAADFGETLGNCGCTDYHMADCPLRTSQQDFENDQYAAEDRWYDEDN